MSHETKTLIFFPGNDFIVNNRVNAIHSSYSVLMVFSLFENL